MVGLFCAASLTALSGCGGSSSGSEAFKSTAPSTEFMKKGGNNRPATFGAEAGEEEREAASTVLEESLRARAAGDWAAQCSTLTAARIDQLESDAPNFGGGKGCVITLKEEAEPLSATKEVRADTMIEPIAVLRVQGKLGYAIYRGTSGKDYAMLMEREGGEWKVARLATTNVP